MGTCVKVVCTNLVMATTCGTLTTFLHTLNSSGSPLCFLVVSTMVGMKLSITFVVCNNVNMRKYTCTAIVTRKVSTMLYFVCVIGGFPVLRLGGRGFEFSLPTYKGLVTLKIPVTLRFSVATVKAVVMRNTMGICKRSCVTNFSTTTGVRGMVYAMFITFNTAVTACIKRG